MAFYVSHEALDPQTMAQSHRYKITEVLGQMDGDEAISLIARYWGLCILEDEGFYNFLMEEGYLQTNQKTNDYENREHQCRRT